MLGDVLEVLAYREVLWTYALALAAADAGVLHPEVRGAADPAVIDGLGDPPGQKGRSARAHVPVGAALEDGAEEGIDLFFGVLVNFWTFSGVERSKIGVQVSGIRTA